MENLAERAARLVARQPLAALSLQEVVHLLRRDTPDPPPDEEYLLESLRRRPDLVRIVDPWQGVWARLGDSVAAAPYLPLLREQGLSPRWPLVVAVADAHFDEADQSARTLNRLGRSLRYLSKTVDAHSPLRLTRWCRLLREQRAILGSITGESLLPRG